jgi:hypothetical protein
MEYPTVEIVGEYQGQAVANPLPFPEPVIYDGALQKLRVQDSGGVIAERACIISNLFIFELGRMLKEAIYGQVHCGCRLETDGDGIFRRTSDLVAVKIISKAKLRQLSDRTQENPLKVIDSPSSSLTSAPPPLLCLFCTRKSPCCSMWATLIPISWDRFVVSKIPLITLAS